MEEASWKGLRARWDTNGAEKGKGGWESGELWLVWGLDECQHECLIWKRLFPLLGTAVTMFELISVLGESGSPCISDFLDDTCFCITKYENIHKKI